MELILTNVTPLSFGIRIKVYQNNHLLARFKRSERVYVPHVDMNKPLRIEIYHSLFHRLMYLLFLAVVIVVFEEVVEPFSFVYCATFMPQEKVVLTYQHQELPFSSEQPLQWLKNGYYMPRLEFIVCSMLFSVIIGVLIILVGGLVTIHWILALIGAVFVCVGGYFVLKQYQKLYRLFQRRKVLKS